MLQHASTCFLIASSNSGGPISPFELTNDLQRCKSITAAREWARVETKPSTLQLFTLQVLESSEAAVRPRRRELVEVVAAEDHAGIDLELLEALVQLPGKSKRADHRKDLAQTCFEKGATLRMDSIELSILVHLSE
jgi:hypothetical protein